MTVLYSVLHMLIDGVCAIAMFGWFRLGEQGYLNILLYNFCAFALQMPLGAMLDLWNAGNRTAGKMAGGFFAAKFGIRKTIVVSLLMAATIWVVGIIGFV